MLERNKSKMTIQQKNEIKAIRRAILDALPIGVDKVNIIIALAQAQQTIAELIIENDPEDDPWIKEMLVDE